MAVIRPDQLKLLRVTILDRNLTEAAGDLGVSYMRVKRMETGENRVTNGYLRKFSDVYGITFETVEALREVERAIEKTQQTRRKEQPEAVT